MRISVLGDGSFGTALAQTFARNGHEVILWCYNPEVAQAIEKTHINSYFMPNQTLLPSIKSTTSLHDAFVHVDWIVEAIPMAYLESVLRTCKPFAEPLIPWVLASKGLDHKTGLLPSEILEKTLNVTSSVVLSGPSFAQELCAGLPTALTLASKDLTYAHELTSILEQEMLFIECVEDYRAVQWCGALKNVIALALGLVEGAGYGENAKAFLYTRLIEEIQHFLKEEKLDTSCLFSFAGIGDITLTAYSTQSRNTKLGKAIGMKKNLGSTLPYTEGLNTLQALPARISLSRMPIINAVYSIILHEHDVSILFAACNTR